MATKTQPAQAGGKTGNGISLGRAQPLLDQQARETQPFGSIVRMPIALDEAACAKSVALLNQALADTLTLRDLYRKHHWQTSGPTFYQLHLLFEKHYKEQDALADELAERVQMLGGVSVAAPHDIVEMTRITRPAKGREEVPVQLSRLLEGHRLVLEHARRAAREASEAGDDGTNDLLVSDVVRLNEKQAWFLAEHLVDTPLVQAE